MEMTDKDNIIRRNTIQKDLVLDAVRSIKRHVTADEVYHYVAANHPSIGKGTVYRNLNILAEEGEIKKILIPNAPDRFDFTLEDHYHVICVKCKCVQDVDIDMNGLANLTDSIKNAHGMKFLDYDILFRGICSKCQGNM